METHPVVVIGAGPGGYRAAFMAADLGLEVTLIDPRQNPGGVCLYQGCIPTKALLHLAKVKEEALKASAWGLTFQEPVIDRAQVKAWKESVVKQLTGGLGQLTKARKINYIQGWARFVDQHTLEIRQETVGDRRGGATAPPGSAEDNRRGGATAPPVSAEDNRRGGATAPPVSAEGSRRGGATAPPVSAEGSRRGGATAPPVYAEGKDEGEEVKRIKFGAVIIATGVQPVKLPFIKEYTQRIMNAERALDLEFIPEKLLVVGGGYIGMESATIYKALGSKVSLVEATPAIMPTMDPELVNIYLRQNKDLFEEKWFETLVTGMEEKGDKVVVRVKKVTGDRLPVTGYQLPVTGDGKEQEEVIREFDAVLLSVGMRPETSSLGLENAGIQKDERGFIIADEQGKTNVPNIYAIGDVVGGMLLAHKASYQGRVAAEVIAGRKSAWDARAVPAVVYTDPEIATAGLSEKECQDQGIPYRTVKFPWSASGRAVASGDPAGLTKLIIEEGTERVLGAGIVGKNAGDLISEAVLGIEMAARVSDIGLSIHPHPTVSETIMEAAELYHGTPTHIAPPKGKKA